MTNCACFWVACCFKADNFPFIWPIKFVRVVVSLFFGMFYIAVINVYLVMLQCGKDPVTGIWVHAEWGVGGCGRQTGGEGLGVVWKWGGGGSADGGGSLVGSRQPRTGKGRGSTRGWAPWAPRPKLHVSK